MLFCPAIAEFWLAIQTYEGLDFNHEIECGQMLRISLYVASLTIIQRDLYEKPPDTSGWYENLFS